MTDQLTALQNLVKSIGAKDAMHAVQLGKAATKIEKVWAAKAAVLVRALTREVLDNAKETGRLSFAGVDFIPFLMAHSFAATREGIASTKRRQPVAAVTRLGRYPSGKIPTDLRELRIWWDRWRKTKDPSPRQKMLGEKLRKAYCDRVQEEWVKHGEDFRAGNTASITEPVRQIMAGAEVATKRAKMIVETETTYYYNKARRSVYDRSPDVTHYLFVALRDHATTEWCKSRQGLVYKVGDPLLEDETPPIHWNCRSELLPLSPLNPNHLALINDKAIARRQHSCKPLPEGWTAR